MHGRVYPHQKWRNATNHVDNKFLKRAMPIAEINNIYYLHVSNPCGVREYLLLKKYFAKTYDSKIKLSYLKELL